MIKLVIIVCFSVAVAVSVMLYVFTDSSAKLQLQLIKNEQRTRDSLSQIITKFVTESEKLNAKIDSMQHQLNNEIKNFRYDLFRIKIIKVPTVNYDNISDTLLISRLLSDYKGR